MEVTEIPSSRKLTRVGNSWGGTVPREILEEYDLLDDGEPSASGTVVFDDEAERVGIVFESESESESE